MRQASHLFAITGWASKEKEEGRRKVEMMRWRRRRWKPVDTPIQLKYLLFIPVWIQRQIPLGETRIYLCESNYNLQIRVDNPTWLIFDLSPSLYLLTVLLLILLSVHCLRCQRILLEWMFIDTVSTVIRQSFDSDYGSTFRLTFRLTCQYAS